MTFWTLVDKHFEGIMAGLGALALGVGFLVYVHLLSRD